jgi:hypothetical protein
LLHAFSENDTSEWLSKAKQDIVRALGDDGNEYKDFLQIDWKEELERYINKGNWNCSIVDVIPCILSKVYDKNLIILNFDRDNFTNGTSFNEDSQNKLIIGKFNEHYWKIKVCQKSTKEGGEKYRMNTIVLPYINEKHANRVKKIGRLARLISTFHSNPIVFTSYVTIKNVIMIKKILENRKVLSTSLLVRSAS